ncbi:hypothetical protein ACH42_02655 [Endozoicomonas sp. (ex Bugula neritina AB1)]|nr:hypothetical protein ACH42_02655 [Endozoicomonas sp. (ex Bugula neritina AB1)]
MLQATTDNNEKAGHPFSENYEVLEGKKRSKTPMVTEMFSIYCGGCYMWEQRTLTELKTKLAQKNIPFQQGHVNFMGQYGEKVTIALAIAQQTQHYDALKRIMFERIQKKRKDWSSDVDFFSTLQSTGFSEEDYNRHKSSMFVLKTLSDWQELQQSIQTVPSFIVNNKYLIKSQGIKSTDQFVELIEYLIKQP